MATTSDVKVTPGTGKNVATYSFTEDAETKEAQRVALNGSDGVENFGTTADSAATSDTGTFTFIALFKRLLQYQGLTTAPTYTNLVHGMTAQMLGTASVPVTGMGAPAAGQFNYITQVTVSNASTSIDTEVVLQDGSAGTSFYTIPAAHGCGGATLTFDPPLKQPTAATALYAKDLTTGAAVTVSVAGYTAP